jgi:arsenate reductase (glutaredoxin)
MVVDPPHLRNLVEWVECTPWNSVVAEIIGHEREGRSMAKVRMLYNPRCGTCRKAAGLLEEKGIEVGLVEYLESPPAKGDLERLLKKLKLKPIDIMRRKEAAFKENNLDDPSLSDDNLLDAMVANPILIQRPIIVSGGKAVIGRPAEKVLEIF